MAIRLSENFRAVFYAPFYAAHALGHYEAEGVEVELVTSSVPGEALAALLKGGVDLTWGGPMRVMKHHDEHPLPGPGASPLVYFCEVATRDPFFLVGPTPNPNFRLTDLARLRFASVAEVPTPWLCLQDDLRRIGVDPAGLDRIADRTMDENLAALREGTRDVVQLFEPFVSAAERDGVGHVWHAASARGPTAYTTFYATRASVARHRDEFVRMTRAMQRTLRWIAERGDGEELAAATASFFPRVPPELLARSLRRYAGSGVWARSPETSREGFERLRAALLSDGFISRAIPYEECVDESLAADAAMR